MPIFPVDAYADEPGAAPAHGGTKVTPMALDLGELHRWIESEAARRRIPGDSMADLIDQCEALQPHPDWAEFRSLPYNDLSPLATWIETTFQHDPPDRPLRGLWFGLFHPCPDGHTPTLDLYVCGSERFDPDPTDNTWAALPEWRPIPPEAESGVLAEIYRIAHRPESRPAKRKAALGVAAEGSLGLGYAAFAVRELIEQIEPVLILGKARSVGVAVGFDDGDFVCLGELTGRGLSAPDPNPAPRPK